MGGIDGRIGNTSSGDNVAAIAPLIGCAGWALAKDTASHFPGDGSHLQRYAARFNAVEINSSFYRPHRPATYARWADSVPSAFRFSVKLPRSITHEQRLANSAALLQQFADEAGALGEKLGCVLVQLPPSLQFDAALAADFIAELRSRFSCMLALEARHASWFAEQASALLQLNGISRVVADPPAGSSEPHIATAPAIYMRLHGAPKIYYSSYNEAEIIQLALKLDNARRSSRISWCIFDNTAANQAISNALSLISELNSCNILSE